MASTKMEYYKEGQLLQFCQPGDAPRDYPWLVISHGQNMQKHTFYDVAKDSCYSGLVPELRRKRLWTSSYGWLLLVDFVTNDSCLLSPVSMKKIQLPPLDKSYQGPWVKCICSKPPTHADCHILLLSSATMPILICYPGDEKFVEHSSKFEDDYLVRATNFKGKIYGLMRPSYTLVTVEVRGLTIRVQQLIKGGMPFQIFQPREGEVCLNYLIESSEEILYVLEKHSSSFINEISDFKVFRVDTSQMTCEEVTSLGDRTVFLNSSSGISCSSTTSSQVRKNCIYFMNNCDKNVYVYDFENRSRTMLTPCLIVKRLQPGMCWVMMP